MQKFNKLFTRSHIRLFGIYDLLSIISGIFQNQSIHAGIIKEALWGKNMEMPSLSILGKLPSQRFDVLDIHTSFRMLSGPDFIHYTTKQTTKAETHKEVVRTFYRELYPDIMLPMGEKISTHHDNFDNIFSRHPRKPLGSIKDLETRWTIKDESFQDYRVDFEKVDKGEIHKLFERCRTNGSFVVIDLLALPYALRHLKREEFCTTSFRGLSVSYSDTRTDNVKDEDTQLDISHLPGNLRTSKTWNEMVQWAGEDNVDLIMERGFGGLHYISNNTGYYRAAGGRLWKMLKNDGGMMVLQLPSLGYLTENGVDIDGWVEKLTKQGIAHRYVPSYISRDSFLSYGLLMLTKNTEPNIPDLMLPPVKKFQ